jgi:NAD(P)-dependent dehydrogenase (short-subunit alcohol dehydrogenase family)
MRDKVVIVTGASSGIGKTTAERFAQRGASVVVAARRSEEGESVAKEIRKTGGEARFIRTDVSSEEDVQALVEQTVEAYGRLDCAFNNAGGAPTAPRGRIHEYPVDDWDAVVDVHLKGIFLCMKHEIRQMLEQGGGAIVNMSSIYGLSADRIAYPSYVASKHGVIGLTRSAAVQYARKNVRVNAVCPGVIRTPMLDRSLQINPEAEVRYTALHPIGRLGEPEEVADSVIWLCSDQASFVTGHAMTIDGGATAET